MDPSQNREEASSPETAAENHDDSEVTTPKDLVEALELASAFKTIRRDASSSGQDIGENLDSVLSKDLSNRLDSIVLIPRSRQRRASVITRTPARSIATSTPSTSPNPPPLPPKRCQSLGPIIPPRPRSCSPSCSDLSSINGDVFSESETSDHQGLNPIPISRPLDFFQALSPRFNALPLVTIKIPVIKITPTMEDTQKK